MHQQFGQKVVWKKDIEKLEKVQHRATKIESLRGMDYVSRRKHLGLPTLEERRKRGDLIQLFKIIKSNVKIDFDEPLNILRV
jgi:ribonuclease P/MRP protein subunit RPP40